MQYIYPSFLALTEVGKSIIFFPFWWYTHVLRDKAREAWRNLDDCRQLLHLSILIRHLFSPLYGSKGWEAKAISVLVRVGHLFYHTVVTLCFTAFFLTGFLLWIVLPIIVLWNIAFQAGLMDFTLYDLLFRT